MSIHRIRLREPWNASRVSEVSREICYRRNFNKPTGLLPEQVVDLCVELFVPCDVELSINEQVCNLERLWTRDLEQGAEGGQPTREPSVATNSEPSVVAAWAARVDEILQSQNRIVLRVTPPAISLSGQGLVPPIGQTLVSEVALQILELGSPTHLKMGVLGDERSS